jgi:hypothetical protein
VEKRCDVVVEPEVRLVLPLREDALLRLPLCRYGILDGGLRAIFETMAVPAAS